MAEPLDKRIWEAVEANLEGFVDRFFQPSPLFEWMMNFKHEITGRQILELKAALFKKSRKEREKAAKMLESLERFPRKEGDVVKYQ